MNNLELFAEEFKYRHTFDGEDVQTLKNNFPSINFSNIPDAWVLGLDELLSQISSGEILGISQRNGFLSISVKGDECSDENIIEKFETRIYNLDRDLHKMLE